MRRKSRKLENNGTENSTGDETNTNGSTHNNDEASDVSEPEPKRRKGGKKSVSPKKPAKQKAQEEINDDNDEENKDDDRNDEESDGKAKSPVPDSKKRRSGKKASLSAKKVAKKDAEKEDEEEEDKEKEYEVESIVAERVVRGTKQYLIKWKGYDSAANTWEDENSINCPELLNEFLSKRKKSKKSKGRSTLKSKEATPDWDENEEFEVDRILEVHHKRKGGREFLVTWKGYPPSQSSWVDEEVMNCKDLIAKFMDRVEKAKSSSEKVLRVNRKPTDRFTLNTTEHGRRLSKRHIGRQRVQYHDTE